MENPQTWGELERRIREVRRQWERDHDDMVCGLSLERRIADEVREWYKEAVDSIETNDDDGSTIPAWSFALKLEERLFGRSG